MVKKPNSVIVSRLVMIFVNRLLTIQRADWPAQMIDKTRFQICAAVEL